MKNLMKKIGNWIKRNYITCTIVVAIVLVVIASIIIVGLIKPQKNKLELSTENSQFYQYFSTNKNEFAAKVSMENNKIVNINSDTYEVYANTPVYYAEKTGLIIPKTSAIVFYYRDSLTYRLPKYSKLENLDDADMVNSNGASQAANNFFIYDGDDLYIIPVASTLKVNGKEISLSGYSYVIADQNGITYYNYETQEVEIIDEQIDNATLIINDIGIDLLNDVTVINSKVGLLPSSVDKLKIYLED